MTQLVIFPDNDLYDFTKCPNRISSRLLEKEVPQKESLEEFYVDLNSNVEIVFRAESMANLSMSLGFCRGSSVEGKMSRSRVKSRGSRVKSRGSRVKSRESRVKSRGSRVKCRGSRVKSRGSRVKSRGSRVKCRGSKEKSRGSRVKSREWLVF